MKQRIEKMLIHMLERDSLKSNGPRECIRNYEHQDQLFTEYHWHFYGLNFLLCTLKIFMQHLMWLFLPFTRVFPSIKRNYVNLVNQFLIRKRLEKWGDIKLRVSVAKKRRDQMSIISRDWTLRMLLRLCSLICVVIWRLSRVVELLHNSKGKIYSK